VPYREKIIGERMAETTLQTLGHMVFSGLLKGPVKKIYQKILSKSPRFKSMCVDKTASVSVKLEGLEKRRQAVERSVDALQGQRIEAEEQYNALQKKSREMKTLQQTIESDAELKLALRKLVESGVTDSLSQSGNVNTLLSQDQALTQEIANLQQQQISLITDYIGSFRQSHRAFSQALMQLGREVPLKNDDPEYAYQDICVVGAEVIMLELSEQFRASCRETPMGYRHMELDEFISLGVKATQSFFNLDSKWADLIQRSLKDALTSLFHELVEFHSRFFSTQKAIGEVFNQESQQFQVLSKKVGELNKLIGEYVSRLTTLTKPAEVAAYEREAQVRPSAGPEDRPPPELRPR